MKACAVCHNEVEERDLVMSERGEICMECNLNAPTARTIDPAAVSGLIAGAVPFFLYLSLTMGGRSYNFVALIGGVIALGAAFVAFNNARKLDVQKNKHLAIAGLVALLGVVQLVRGIGMVG